ncbi:MAG TPA: LacI family DNA-binding transcriptional regulator [Spirochaetales bacterium]|nr:LacI family DNA-binding transcriptional regulator [Spirochaetales bacterium]
MKNQGVTIREVAEYAQVSTATVSRVLNGDPRVIDLTRAKVLDAIEKLDYKVNSVARSLKTNKTRTIGIMAPDLAGDYFMYIAESMDKELANHGYSLVVCVSHDSPEEEAKRLRHLAERLVDGIVVIPATSKGKHFGFLKELNIPFVFVDRTVNDIEADSVLVDNEEGAFEATKALINDGYTRIGYVGGLQDISIFRERFQGYKRAMESSTLTVEDDFVRFFPPTLPFGYRAMEEMMHRPESPDAWFIANAFMHIGATNYVISEAGERASRIVFAAFDEMPYSPLLVHCRYAVQQPIAEMGKTAARLILKRIDQVDAEESYQPQQLRLKTRLITHKPHA